MELLQIHAEFRLGDGFKGNISDALREMAAYMESEEANKREVKHSENTHKEQPLGAWESEALQTLKTLNKKDGTRFVGEFFLGFYDYSIKT